MVLSSLKSGAQVVIASSPANIFYQNSDDYAEVAKDPTGHALDFWDDVKESMSLEDVEDEQPDGNGLSTQAIAAGIVGISVLITVMQ